MSYEDDIFKIQRFPTLQLTCFFWSSCLNVFLMPAWVLGVCQSHKTTPVLGKEPAR